MRVLDLVRGVSSLATLSASFIAETPHLTWLAAQIAARVIVRVHRAPVLRPNRGLVVGHDEISPVCSLVSDTHVTAGSRAPSELVDDDRSEWPWGAPPKGDDVARGLQRVLDDVARRAPRTLIWCGDEVDTGAAEEWTRLRAIARSTPQVVHHLVPGNHDINFNRPFVIDHDLSRRSARIDAFESHAASLACYPRIETVEGDAGPVTVVLLDSCRHPSTHVLSNAIGRYGREQLARLAEYLRDVRGPLLCVTHHHVWRDPRFANPEMWFNTAVDADALAKILVAYRRRGDDHHVLICHGHRHAFVAGEIGPPDAALPVIGLPSTTLGDTAATGQHDGIVRYLVAGLSRTGQGWRVAVRELGPLVSRSPTDSARWTSEPDPSLHPYAVVRP